MIYFLLLIEIYIVIHLILLVYIAQKKLNKEIKLSHFHTTDHKIGAKVDASA